MNDFGTPSLSPPLPSQQGHRAARTYIMGILFLAGDGCVQFPSLTPGNYIQTTGHIRDALQLSQQRPSTHQPAGGHASPAHRKPPTPGPPREQRRPWLFTGQPRYTHDTLNAAPLHTTRLPDTSSATFSPSRRLRVVCNKPTAFK